MKEHRWYVLSLFWIFFFFFWNYGNNTWLESKIRSGNSFITIYTYHITIVSILLSVIWTRCNYSATNLIEKELKNKKITFVEVELIGRVKGIHWSLLLWFKSWIILFYTFRKPLSISFVKPFFCWKSFSHLTKKPRLK